MLCLNAMLVCSCEKVRTCKCQRVDRGLKNRCYLRHCRWEGS